MPRIPIVAGNWKMNKTPAEAVEFVRELTLRLQPLAGVEKIVCPAYVALPGVAAALTDTDIAVGAQNVSAAASGAFTSQISAAMLTGLVKYVIIGHSEARQHLGETDALINAKLKLALAAGLKPIFAVGESRETRDTGEAHTFVAAQVRAGLSGLSAEQVSDLVIAYEPIWAIGTGLTAQPSDANDMCQKVVRATVRELYGDEVAQSVRVQYGGSVTADNAAELMAYPDIDGALVGGASLKLNDFTLIVEKTAAAKARA